MNPTTTTAPAPTTTTTTSGGVLAPTTPTTSAGSGSDDTGSPGGSDGSESVEHVAIWIGTGPLPDDERPRGFPDADASSERRARDGSDLAAFRGDGGWTPLAAFLAGLVALGVFGLVGGGWFLVPFWRRRRNEDEEHTREVGPARS
ncbi:MAG: hypothetical protein HYU28_10890 [Actinobacteria bacterium]|nr:hypothetical protein [Actinomycetota bacterium]